MLRRSSPPWQYHYMRRRLSLMVAWAATLWSPFALAGEQPAVPVPADRAWQMYEQCLRFDWGGLALALDLRDLCSRMTAGQRPTGHGRTSGDQATQSDGVPGSAMGTAGR